MLSGLSVFKFIESIFRLIYVQTHLCLVYLCPCEYVTRSICVHVNQYSINLFSGVSVFRSICFCFRTVCSRSNCIRVKPYSGQSLLSSMCSGQSVLSGQPVFRFIRICVCLLSGLLSGLSVFRSICVHG